MISRSTVLVGWACRIHWLYLCKGVRPPPMSVLDMTLINLIVRLHWRWSWWECRLLLYWYFSLIHAGPVVQSAGGGGCRIHRLHLCRGVRTFPKQCSGYDTKQSEGKVQAMLGLWGMRSTFSLSLLPSALWPGMVAVGRTLSMGQIQLKCVLMLKWIVWIRTVWLSWTTWNRNVFDTLTVYLC